MIAFGTRQWLSLYLAEKRALAGDRADGRDKDEQDALAGRRTHGGGGLLPDRSRGLRTGRREEKPSVKVITE